MATLRYAVTGATRGAVSPLVGGDLLEDRTNLAVGSASLPSSRPLASPPTKVGREAGRPGGFTDRGRPAHVLLSYRAYEQLLGDRGDRPIADILGEPRGVEDVELPLPRIDDVPRPAELT